MQVTDQYATLSLAESIVLRIGDGDKLAEQELVATYYRGLYFILNRQSNNPALSEDIAQDTFIVVIQKARQHGIQNPAALSAFIRQTGINLLIGHFRKETRRDTQCSPDIEIHSPTDGMDISRALHSEHMLQLVTQLLNELSTQRDRDLLRNYFVYEKTKAHICQELDLSAEHFDRVLFRARQRLKQLIQYKIGSSDSSTPATLLSLTILLGMFTNSTDFVAQSDIFLLSLRDSQTPTHLVYATLNNSSPCQGKQLKPGRCQ